MLSPDDLAKIRTKDYSIARDNLLYEAGLSTGIYGKHRCFLIIAKKIDDFHLPSDLGGLTLGLYDNKEIDVDKAMIEPCKKIYEAISQNIWATLKIEITANFIQASDLKTTYKSKLKFHLTNEESFPVTIELKRCNLPSLTIDRQHKIYGGKNYYQPTFFIYQLNGVDIYERKFDFKPGETKTGWIPLDLKYSNEQIQKLISSDQTCVLNYQCTFEKDNHSTVIDRTVFI